MNLQERTRKWFENHQIQGPVEIKIDNDVKGEYIKWSKPGTMVYMVDYYIIGNELHVSGDIGYAIYKWSDRINWDFLGNCGQDYFCSKCVCSSTGIKQWYEELAVQRLVECVNDHHSYYEVKKDLSNSEVNEYLINEFTCTIPEITGSPESWHDFCYSNGFDWGSGGEYYSINLIAHHTGLKMVKEMKIEVK